jgi:hypothetical protein
VLTENRERDREFESGFLQRQKPQPTKTVYAKGSVEWFAEQKKSG